MADEIHVVLLLDVAEQNPIDEAMVVAQLPPGASSPTVLRLTDFEPARHGAGTPVRWLRTISAIDRMLRAARAPEREGRVRYWVAGRAGLPAFFYLGYRLTKKATVTLVNPRDAGPPDVLALDPIARTGRAPSFFARSSWPSRPTISSVTLGLIVSSRIHVSPEQVEALMSQRGSPPAAIVEAQAGGMLDENTMASALHELDEQIAGIATWYPRCDALAVFIAGPATLAFLVGRAINPHIFPDVQVFQHRDHQYELAYETRSRRTKHPILFLASNPSSTSRLAIDEEAHAIQQELERSQHRDRFEVHLRAAVRARELRKLIQAVQPTVVHFSGHGDADGLVFHDDDGTSRTVSSEILRELFSADGLAVQIVVLNACYSEANVEALLEVVDCVIGIPGSISDDAARSFSIGFYGAIGDHESVQAAYDLGCLAMRIQESPGGRPSRAARDVRADGASGPEEHDGRGLPTLWVGPGIDAGVLTLAARPS